MTASPAERRYAPISFGAGSTALVPLSQVRTLMAGLHDVSGGNLPRNLDTLIALGRWRDFLASGYAPKTQRMYLRSAMRFFVDTGVPLTEVTELDLARWLEGFAFRSASRATHYDGLKSLFTWAQRNEVRPDNPLAGIRVPSPTEKVPRALTPEQFEAVRAAAYRHHPTHGYTVDLLFYSAGRIGEVLALRWEDATEEGLVFRRTKNGKERRVPWTPGLRRAVAGLRQWFGEQERIVPRTQQTVWDWLRKAGTSAGVAHVHPHLFRSTAATRSLARGARPQAVRALLGHAKLNTTERYFAIEEGDVQQAVDLLNDERPSR